METEAAALQNERKLDGRRTKQIVALTTDYFCSPAGGASIVLSRAESLKDVFKEKVSKTHP